MWPEGVGLICKYVLLTKKKAPDKGQNLSSLKTRYDNQDCYGQTGDKYVVISPKMDPMPRKTD
jgi:hypothetical protein